SPLLTTTKKFQEYFRLSHDAKSLRQELKSQDKAADETAAVETGVVETAADETAVLETTVASDNESSDAVTEPVFEPPAAEETIQVDPVSIPGNPPEAVLNVDEIRT